MWIAAYQKFVATPSRVTQGVQTDEPLPSSLTTNQVSSAVQTTQRSFTNAAVQCSPEENTSYPTPRPSINRLERIQIDLPTPTDEKTSYAPLTIRIEPPERNRSVSESPMDIESPKSIRASERSWSIRSSHSPPASPKGTDHKMQVEATPLLSVTNISVPLETRTQEMIVEPINATPVAASLSSADSLLTSTPVAQPRTPIQPTAVSTPQLLGVKRKFGEVTNSPLSTPGRPRPPPPGPYSGYQIQTPRIPQAPRALTMSTSLPNVQPRAPFTPTSMSVNPSPVASNQADVDRARQTLGQLQKLGIIAIKEEARSDQEVLGLLQPNSSVSTTYGAPNSHFGLNTAASTPTGKSLS